MSSGSNARVSLEPEVAVTPQESASSNLRTFVRVKRHIDEDPATALVLSFKRQKVDGKVSEQKPTFEVVNSVLKFAGSIQPEQKIEAFVKSLEKLADGSVKESFRRTFPVKPSNSARRQKTQQEVKQKSEACRYKVINTKRGLDDITNVETKENDDSNYLYSMFDLVSDGHFAQEKKPDFAQDDVITCNGAPMVVVQNPLNYVFDVYTTSNPLSMEGHDVNVEHLWEFSDNCLESGESDEDRYGHNQDDSDSNEENHRGNDYPDEESDASDESNRSDRDDVYDSDDGVPNVGGIGQMGTSRAMKELAQHVKTLKLGGYSSKQVLDDSSDEEFDADYEVYGAST